MIPGQIDLIHALKEASLPSGKNKEVSREFLIEKYSENPLPGSDDAYTNGCKCSILDNFNGQGQTFPDGTIIYRVSSVCEIHGELIN